MRLAPTLATACCVLCFLLTPAGGAAAGCAEAAGVDRFAGLDEDGTLRLDGRGAVRLAELRLPEDGPARDAALAWLRGRIGAPLAVRETGPRDRWERLPVRLSPQAADAGDFAEGLVEAGLALVDPSGAEVLCRPELLALEETARDRGLGVWAEDRYKPVAAEAVTRLTERIGRFTLVEGRVRSVGERKQRTYVNFGTDWSSDFTLIVPKRVWTALQGRRIDAAFLRGRTLRMRGILEGWQGVAITVNVPETVELVQGGRGRR
jgi:hypothetical protein